MHACIAFVMHIIVYYQELEYATHDCVQAYVVYYVMRIYINNPTKLMYEHRVDYYDYTTVVHSILQYYYYTYMQQLSYISKQFCASEIARWERGSRVGINVYHVQCPSRPP